MSPLSRVASRRVTLSVYPIFKAELKKFIVTRTKSRKDPVKFYIKSHTWRCYRIRGKPHLSAPSNRSSRFVQNEMRRATMKQIEIGSEIFPVNVKIAVMVPISQNKVNDCNGEFMYVTKASLSFPWKQTVNR